MYYLTLAAFGLLFGLLIELLGSIVGADLHLLTAAAIVAPATLGAGLELRARTQQG